MKKKNQTTIKINPATKDKLFSQALKLSAIEGRKVTMKEIADRTFMSEDVLRELERGSIRRKMRGL